MSIFGDIADAVGDVGNWVEGAASDVANSAVGQLALTGVGTIFGDPALGEQVKGATNVLDKIFGRGSHAARSVGAGTRAARLGPAAFPGFFGPTGATPRAQPAYVAIRVKGKTYRVPRSQLPLLAKRVKALQAVRPVLAPVMTPTPIILQTAFADPVAATLAMASNAQALVQHEEDVRAHDVAVAAAMGLPPPRPPPPAGPLNIGILPVTRRSED